MNKYRDGSLSVKEKQPFDICTGDEYFQDKGISECHVLSINTQGTELAILRGLSDSMEKGLIKTIKIEVDFQLRYSGQNSSQFLGIEQLMYRFGYRMFEILLIKNMVPAGIQMLDILYVHESVDVPR